MVLGWGPALPASVDVLSPSILTRRGLQSDLMGGREMTPAGALKLPLPGGNRLKEVPKTGLLGVLGLDLGRRPRPLSHAAPYRTPDPAAAKAAAGEPLAPSGRHRLKGTQPDCPQLSTGRHSQCACEKRERVHASQWFPRLSRKPRPEAWQTGALRGSAWVSGLPGPA